MALSKHISYPFIAIIVGFFVFHSACALSTRQDYLNVHNQARAEVGVQPLIWNNTVAAYARSYAKLRAGDCKLQHSEGGPYGENIAYGSGGFTVVDAANLWIEEKPLYNYDSNSCVGGECLHYTQVIWRDSTQIGCARVRCTNNGWHFVTCNYYPPGNYIGERPY